MLGVRLVPDGNHREQLQHMKEKMKNFAELIRTGHVTRHEAWISLTMMSMKSLEYPLPAMNLSAKEHADIMKPVLKQYLPKAGINRNIGRDILYAPLSSQGFNLKNPYLSRGVQHVRDIIEHTWKQTLTGSLMKSNLEQLRIELGCNIDIFESNCKIYDKILVTDSFLKQAWKFTPENSITFKYNTQKMQLLRVNDIPIMEAFIANKDIPRTSLQQLNKCRLCLKAFSLADITNASGKEITTQAWHGIQNQNSRNEITNWPSWGRPALQAWSYWRTALKLTFCTDRDKRLRSQLLEWYHIPQGWKWFTLVLPTGKLQVVEKTKDGHRIYKKIGRSKLTLRFHHQGTTYVAKSNDVLLPTTVSRIHTSLIMDAPSAVEQNTYQQEENANLTSWLNVDKHRMGSLDSLTNSILKGYCSERRKLHGKYRPRHGFMDHLDW